MHAHSTRSTLGRLLITLGCVITVLLVLAVAGCGDDASTVTTAAQEGLQDNSGDGKSLTLLDWGGYDTPEFRGDWDTEHPDVKLNWVFANEDSEMYAKMQSGFQNDLVRPVWTKIYADQGLVQPIDTSKITNWGSIPKKMTDHVTYDGKVYFVPTAWGLSSILVRTDKVTTMPKSWADLWNPEYKGHVSIFDSGELGFVVAAKVLGFDPTNTTEDQRAQIKQKLLELKPNLKNYWSDSVALDQEIAAGDVWIAAGAWTTSLISASTNNIPVEYITPTEGVFAWMGGLGVSSTTKNYDLALEFIDSYVSTKAQAAVGNAWGLGVANNDALPLLDPATVTLLKLDAMGTLDSLEFLPPVTDDLRTAYTEIWTEVKAAQ